jgi:hypothetical protein
MFQSLKGFEVDFDPQSAKEVLWTRLTQMSINTAWASEVTDIVDRLVAADTNPNSLLGSDDDYDPGLKKLDVIEYFEGVPEAQRKEIYDRLWLDLAILVGRDDIIAGIDGQISTYGSKFGFS